VREGGAFEGDEAARIALLRRAHETPARYIDIEHDVSESLLTGFDRKRIILSRHDFNEVPPQPSTILTQMADRGVGAVKLACQVSAAEQLTPLHEAARKLQRQQVDAAIIGMGPAGLVSRSHYRAFGSAWTYVAATAQTATAPGQLDLPTALSMNLPRSAGAPLYALVGGPQVFASPGPRTYCALFRAHDLPSSYVPIIVNDLNAALPLLESLGARGLSVTMPLKRSALGVAIPDDLARETGAANTLWRQDDGWHASNTDIRGVRIPLDMTMAEVTRVSGRDARVLILGTGGAARAAVMACAQLRLQITVSGRNIEAASRTVGTRGNTTAWLERSHYPHDILINATAIGGQQCPWPENARINAQIVFDLAIATEPSRLLQRADARGALTLDATAMWVHQGAAQMQLMLKRQIDVEDLETAMSATARLDHSEGAN
jgi:shikimate 5-dehydrogenase